MGDREKGAGMGKWGYAQDCAGCRGSERNYPWWQAALCFEVKTVEVKSQLCYFLPMRWASYSNSEPQFPHLQTRSEYNTHLHRVVVKIT